MNKKILNMKDWTNLVHSDCEPDQIEPKTKPFRLDWTWLNQIWKVWPNEFFYANFRLSQTLLAANRTELCTIPLVVVEDNIGTPAVSTNNNENRLVPQIGRSAWFFWKLFRCPLSSNEHIVLELCHNNKLRQVVDLLLAAVVRW